MCGLVGIAGQMTAKDDAVIKRLLMYDYFRGPDSTGMAAIRGNGDVYLAKLASDPVTLFDTGKFKPLSAASAASIWATIGRLHGGR
jgi:glucosamine 6-phosphate synthetase-like amidotransferase/phosphosugar isomerase protein